MSFFKRIALAGCAAATVLLVSACSGPDTKAKPNESTPVTQQNQDPGVQVIELPAPKGAKPGDKVRAIVTPYPPDSPEGKEAIANALKNADQDKQP